MALEKGVKAPNFTAQTDGGLSVKLSDFAGKWLILYFYPKDDTSGCTKEACEFRDNMERITSMGAVVLGVSPDKVNSHDKFKVKYDLNFALLADPDRAVCKSYDIIGEKSMFGKKYLGVIRTTFIISPKGKIEYVFNKVNVDGHVDEVISKLNELIG